MASAAKPKIILASQSPRRRELLDEAGFEFEVIRPSDTAECGVCSGENPAQLVARLAFQKAADVVRRIAPGTTNGQYPDSATGRDIAGPLAQASGGAARPVSPSVVLGCDTVVECDGQIQGKPNDEEHARAMLTLLSGRRHRVFSGLCLWPLPGGTPLTRVDTTVLRMDRLTPGQLDEYLASGQWEGKAGAFGYQDRLGWVHIEQGSPSNVVGLPTELLADMLAELGYR